MASPSDSSNPEQNIKKGAEPGKGSAGDQWAVQTAEAVGPAVNPPDTDPMPGGDVEGNKQDIQAAKESESDTDLDTTEGYTIDASNRMDNFAVEPEMYVEGEGK